MKDPDDKEKWLIDEPAAEVVRKIFALCLAGRGPLQIAKQLEEEKVLVPSAYYESVGRTHAQKVPSGYCKWDQKTVVHILENRQYTGCAVNFKSTTVSYKVHKVVYNPVEDYQIIPNMQEPIIPEEQWLRVQELRQHRRRPTATGRTSLFSGLVYCPDCGAKDFTDIRKFNLMFKTYQGVTEDSKSRTLPLFQLQIRAWNLYCSLYP